MFATLCLTSLLLLQTPEVASQAEVVIVVGAPGSEEYGERFTAWAEKWQHAAQEGQARLTVIGLKDAETENDLQRLQTVLTEGGQSESPLWLVFIGHGTFDRRDAKFNLRGPDVSAGDLKTWLAPLRRPIAVIDTTAASAPFLTALAADNRVLISATKSGGEQNFPYFGGYLAEAITDMDADLDKDQQVSLWEAFLFASRRTDEFYKTDGRLQTEHAILDDNGDGQGVRAEAFRGLEPIQVAADANQQLDGDRAHQWHLLPNAEEAALPAEVRRQHDRLELEILALKRQKASLSEEDYYQQLEGLLLQLAELRN
ncbi:hypothetical protein GC163_15585 [bacterium]|nr:hypothetical protein [bacterium]